jgi:uncharacterized membrane protein
MQPMIRGHSKPVSAIPTRKVTVVRVMAGLSFTVAALGFLSGSLMAAVLACVSATTLLLAEGLAIRTKDTQDQLEANSRELVAVRLLLAQMAGKTAKQEGNHDANNLLPGSGGYAVPQPAGD